MSITCKNMLPNINEFRKEKGSDPILEQSVKTFVDTTLNAPANFFYYITKGNSSTISKAKKAALYGLPFNKNSPKWTSFATGYFKITLLRRLLKLLFDF